MFGSNRTVFPAAALSKQSKDDKGSLCRVFSHAFQLSSEEAEVGEANQNVNILACKDETRGKNIQGVTMNFSTPSHPRKGCIVWNQNTASSQLDICLASDVKSIGSLGRVASAQVSLAQLLFCFFKKQTLFALATTQRSTENLQSRSSTRSRGWFVADSIAAWIVKETGRF